MRPIKLTPEQTRELYARYETGLPLEQLGPEAGVSWATVWRAFRRLGLRVRGRAEWAQRHGCRPGARDARIEAGFTIAEHEHVWTPDGRECVACGEARRRA